MALAMADANDPKDINRLKFLARLSGEIGKRGVIDVLRKGVEHGPVHFDLFYGTPSPGNAKAGALHAQNRFSVTRQLAYSMDETRRALDARPSRGHHPTGMPDPAVLPGPDGTGYRQSTS